uniref:relaxase/mobilization nuclease domain-containing protein n=1 Tax=Sphaerisporangium sp. CA-236357 TaxID=3240030 RepID=UPI003F49482A
MNNFISAVRGTNTVGLVRYLFGPGSSAEHTNQRVIAADPTLGYADGIRLDHVEDAEQIYALGRDMDSYRLLLGVHPGGGWVWHCAISLPPQESGRLSDEQWAHIARTAIHRLGFDADSEAGRAPCRWLAVHHGLSVGGNDHLHLMVNLVREDGTVASTWNDRRTMSRLCAEMETRYGLAHVEGRAGRGMPSYSKAEHQRMKAGQQIDRQRIARIVRSCAVAAAGEAEFVRLARRSGLLVYPRYSKDGSAVTGYSVALPAGGGNGKAIRYGGGKLAADLTLPRLREHWPSPTESQAQALAEWSRAPGAELEEPEAIYPAGTWLQAAQRVDRITAELAATPHHDVATWSTATQQAAAVTAALSARMETTGRGPVTELADLLARAAQTLPSQPRVPARRGVLADFRGVATVARQAKLGPVWTVLLLALVALARAIADWQHASRPRLAAELAAGLNHVQAAYPPPSPRALAAQQRSPGALTPTKTLQPMTASRLPAMRRDPGRDRGHGL